MNPIFRLSNIISEFKSSIRLAIPLVAAEVIYGLNGFIATVMISHLGKEQLAANALVWSIYIAVIMLFLGVLIAISVMVSQSFGAKDNQSVGICFKQGLIMAIICSIPMMLIIWMAPTVLVWTKQNPTVIAYAKPFFHSLIWSMLPLNIWVVMQQFLTGINKARIVMFMCIMAVPVEILFYYTFLFGKFGLPKLDLAGIGYGLTASYYLISLSFGSYLYFSKQFKIYSLFKKWWIIEYKFFVEIIRVGLPIGFMYCSELIFFAVIAIMMGVLGVTVLAAYQISYQYLVIGLMVIFGLGQTAIVRVGNEVGRNDRGKVKLATIVNIGIALVSMSAFSMFYLLFPERAIGLDINVNSANFKAVANEATRFFPIISVFLLTECIRLVCCNALRGLKDTTFQMVISVFGFWLIAFPAAYLLAFKFGFGGVGVWWGIVIGLFTTGVMFLIRFYRLVERVDLASLVTRK